MQQRDDLGAAMLAAHPRAAEWTELDVSVTALTFDQVDLLSAVTPQRSGDDHARSAARSRVIAGLAGSEFEGRLTSRWVRWCSTFGLEQPDTSLDPSTLLMHPYRLADRTTTDPDPDRRRWAAFVRGVTAIFDAALGVAATGVDPEGFADHHALTGPWSRVCRPCGFGPGDVFGPHHRQALALLASAQQIPRAELDDMIDRRRAVLDPSWALVRGEVFEASTALGYPFRADGLFWEAVTAAETAADQSPTDRELADALWGAAAAVVFADDLAAPTRELLTTPWGRPLTPMAR